MNAKSQGELKKNTNVYLIYTLENDLGEDWTYAMVNGKTGYIMTMYLDMLTQEDSDAISAQASPAPVFALEDVFPTAEPTEVVTIEVTEEPTVPPTATPTEKPTATPTEKPTATPTEKPTATPTEKPTPTPTEAPTATPTEAPTAAPATAEPYQRTGYAITIGDGVPVREWPTANSWIREELAVNKSVYVTGQFYVDGVAWSVAEYDNKWGYVRADLLRMISDSEMQAYMSLIE